MALPQQLCSLDRTWLKSSKFQVTFIISNSSVRRTQRQVSLNRFLDLIPVSLFRGTICLYKSPLSKILFLQLRLVHLHLLITVATNAIAHTIGDNSPAIYTCKINSNHYHIILPNVQFKKLIYHWCHWKRPPGHCLLRLECRSCSSWCSCMCSCSNLFSA